LLVQLDFVALRC